MRRVRPSLKLALLAVSLGVGWTYLPPLESWLSRDDAEPTVAEAQARRTVIYTLEQDRWLTFKIRGWDEDLQVVSNGTVAASRPQNPFENWHYALEYQVLDPQGAVLRHKVYHHRAHLDRYRDPVTKRAFYPAFYRDQSLVPTEGNILRINLRGLSQPSQLRLRLSQKDPILRRIGIRVYEVEGVLESRIPYVWQRLGRANRTRLAAGNVYPVALLTEEEQRNLIAQHYRPLGPAGIAGRDYRAHDLYLIEHHQAQRVDVPVPPLGLPLQPGATGVIPLPEGKTLVRVAFRTLDTAPGIADDAPLTIHWYGKGITERGRYRIPWSEAVTQPFERVLGGGLLTLEAPIPLVARAYVQQFDRFVEITPESRQLRAYIAGPDQPVVFAVTHVEEKPTPFRVTLRPILGTCSGALPGIPWKVDYTLLDAAKRPLKQGTIEYQATCSAYDRWFDHQGQTVAIAEPEERAFALTAAIDYVALRATQPTLVAGYTRPPDLVHTHRVPEDNYSFDPENRRQAAWFSLPPLNKESLLRTSRAPLLQIQHRPPEDDPDVRAGRYQWQDYHPQVQASGRYLLLPFKPQTSALREESLANVFQRLSSGKEQGLHFQALPDKRQLRPTVIVLRDRETPAAFTVSLDGRLFFEGGLYGRRQELQLPPLRVGKHRLRASLSEQAEVFVNYAGPGEAGYLKRFANHFSERRLMVTYTKESSAKELLTVDFYRPWGTEGRIQLTVNIRGPKRPENVPLTGWSLLDRRYSIRSGQGPAVPVLHTQSEWADSGSRMFLVLDEDLPQGNYQIEFTRENEGGGYVSLFRIIPGDAAQRTYFREQGSAENQDP